MTETVKKLTAAKARELFEYCPETGLFARKTKMCNGAQKDFAGYRHKHQGYIVIKVDQVGYLAHRLIFLMIDGEWPDEEVDHINGDRSDNRLCNLRKVTKKQNTKNKALSDRNKSGVSGVSFDAASQAWRARITSDYETLQLGVFGDFFAAVCARKSAELKHGFHENHGARRNG